MTLEKNIRKNVMSRIPPKRNLDLTVNSEPRNYPRSKKIAVSPVEETLEEGEKQEASIFQ